MSITTLTFKVSINASQQEVFEYVMDWKRQSEWIMLTKARKTSIDTNQPGTTIEAWTGVGPLGFLDTMVIELWDPPNQCTVMHTGKVVKGTGVFVVNKISDTKSEFVWEEITPLPLGVVGRIGFWCMRPFLVMMFNRSLKKLKTVVEAKK